MVKVFYSSLLPCFLYVRYLFSLLFFCKFLFLLNLEELILLIFPLLSVCFESNLFTLFLLLLNLEERDIMIPLAPLMVTYVFVYFFSNNLSFLQLILWKFNPLFLMILPIISNDFHVWDLGVMVHIHKNFYISLTLKIMTFVYRF